MNRIGQMDHIVVVLLAREPRLESLLAETEEPVLLDRLFACLRSNPDPRRLAGRFLDGLSHNRSSLWSEQPAREPSAPGSQEILCPPDSSDNPTWGNRPLTSKIHSRPRQGQTARPTFVVEWETMMRETLKTMLVHRLKPSSGRAFGRTRGFRPFFVLASRHGGCVAGLRLDVVRAATAGGAQRGAASGPNTSAGRVGRGVFSGVNPGRRGNQSSSLVLSTKGQDCRAHSLSASFRRPAVHGTVPRGAMLAPEVRISGRRSRKPANP